MMKSDMDKKELEKRLIWYEKRYGPYIEKRGLKNWRNLFRKPTISEWTILVMLILAMFMGWAYQIDTAQCRESLSNLDVVCQGYQDSLILIEPNNTFEEVNFTIFKADHLLDEG